MGTLPLAVDIADAVSRASEEQRPLDPEATASRLADAHPEAEASRDEILDVLREEGAAAGVA
jgi:hypothetical protein